VSAGVALHQPFKQRLGLLEVGSVKAFSEPAVDRRQQLVGLSVLALLLPQATQARGSAQLPRLRLLAPGNVERLLKTGFCLNYLIFLPLLTRH